MVQDGEAEQQTDSVIDKLNTGVRAVAGKSWPSVPR